MYAQFGNIIFEGSKSFQTFEKTGEALFAEHSLINRKNLLQPMGNALDTISFDLTLHQEFCNVALSIIELESAKQLQQPENLIWGNGKVEGKYVIVSLTRQNLQQFDDGALFMCSFKVSLKEYIADTVRVKEQEARKNAPAVNKKQTKKAIVNKDNCSTRAAKYYSIIKNNYKQLQNLKNKATWNGKYTVCEGQNFLNLSKRLLKEIESAAKVISEETINVKSCLYNDSLVKTRAIQIVTRSNLAIQFIDANFNNFTNPLQGISIHIDDLDYWVSALGDALKKHQNNSIIRK